MFSELDIADQDTHLEAAISILDTMEGVAIVEHACTVMVCSECIQLVTEDAVNKRQQEWSDLKIKYLLQLRHSIVMCVCIHMMRDEESSESHDKVPSLLTLPAALSLS